LLINENLIEKEIKYGIIWGMLANFHHEFLFIPYIVQALYN
jgi:hypothetical protein